MGKATGLVYRERIIALRDTGYTLRAIREELGLTYSNVRAICQRYGQEGLAGLQNLTPTVVPPANGVPQWCIGQLSG